MKQKQTAKANSKIYKKTTLEGSTFFDTNDYSDSRFRNKNQTSEIIHKILARKKTHFPKKLIAVPKTPKDEKTSILH